MDKQKMFRYVNVILIPAFLVQVISVVLMAAGASPRHFFREAHELNGAILVITSIAHIILNWSWIKFNVLGKARSS